ncbi:ligase-associated DNA damage response endonuclease PdeM [uncultured Cohaesibacter sp.]|uniref:ligase-associated DNA damage response endonuclease PdeM n=1 Tax=uncultured Cohaesibacter sp. TaxID=1002546 RepID=UPI00292DC60D|nr:ligase-associated DNA damage response endonuclease PdeM [uncultured Cohaesibacter sp.]
MHDHRISAKGGMHRASGEVSSGLSSRSHLAFDHAGECFVASTSGALFWPDRETLLVADLHLEKGSAYARGGQFLPPYDSQATLDQLARDIAHFSPARVICLGDSFHDVEGPARMSDPVMQRLKSLGDGLDWTWIIGNHDPVIASSVKGMVAESLTLQGNHREVTLCHEPQQTAEEGQATSQALELCGHLHPVTTIHARGRAMRRKCFVLSAGRIILPAYGAYTGGLSLSDDAFAALIDKDTRLVVIGRQTMAITKWADLSRVRRR